MENTKKKCYIVQHDSRQEIVFNFSGGDNYQIIYSGAIVSGKKDFNKDRINEIMHLNFQK